MKGSNWNSFQRFLQLGDLVSRALPFFFRCARSTAARRREEEVANLWRMAADSTVEAFLSGLGGKGVGGCFRIKERTKKQHLRLYHTGRNRSRFTTDRLWHEPRQTSRRCIAGGPCAKCCEGPPPAQQEALSCC